MATRSLGNRGRSAINGGNNARKPPNTECWQHLGRKGKLEISLQESDATCDYQYGWWIWSSCGDAGRTAGRGSSLEAIWVKAMIYSHLIWHIPCHSDLRLASILMFLLLRIVTTFQQQPKKMRFRWIHRHHDLWVWRAPLSVGLSPESSLPPKYLSHVIIIRGTRFGKLCLPSVVDAFRVVARRICSLQQAAFIDLLLGVVNSLQVFRRCWHFYLSELFWHRQNPAI